MNHERDLAKLTLKHHRDIEKATVELITIGLLVIHKWDRINKAEEDKSLPPLTNDEIIKIQNSFTDSDINQFKLVASISLETEIKNRQNRSWWSGVAQSLLATFIYSIILLIVVVSVNFFGSDFLTVLKSITRTN